MKTQPRQGVSGSAGSGRAAWMVRPGGKPTVPSVGFSTAAATTRRSGQRSAGAVARSYAGRALRAAVRRQKVGDRPMHEQTGHDGIRYSRRPPAGFDRRQRELSIVRLVARGIAYVPVAGRASCGPWIVFVKLHAARPAWESIAHVPVAAPALGLPQIISVERSNHTGLM